VTRLAPTAWWRGLAGLTRSGSAVEGLSWALYDFANTIFSFAIVSCAMSLWSIPGPLGKTAYQIAILSLLVLMAIGYMMFRGVPEGTVHLGEEAELATAIEPAIVPPGEAP
jgi:hypothetical protein